MFAGGLFASNLNIKIWRAVRNVELFVFEFAHHFALLLLIEYDNA
jgi:hypothetical protein